MNPDKEIAIRKRLARGDNPQDVAKIFGVDDISKYLPKKKTRKRK